MNPSVLSHFSWPVSPYSAKTRAYLRWKSAPFQDVLVTGHQLFWKIRPAVGRVVMPTVQTPQGDWLQDSSVIIESLEAGGDLPGPSIEPPGKRQRLANLLLEFHGDEWLSVAALHKRWNNPVNDRFARQEFGKYAFPWLPGAIARRLAAPMADRMASYLPKLGIDETTGPGVDAFCAGLIAQMQCHFEDSGLPYLLGGRPGLGDFALYGPLWAHLYRDPGTTELFDDAPAVVAWMDRLGAPSDDDRRGDFLPDDEVPQTLDPLFRTMFAEQMLFVDSLVDAINTWCEGHPDATRLPRSLGDAPFVIGGRSGVRKLVTFTAWMLQRPLDAYAVDRSACDSWLDRLGGSSLADTVPDRRQVMKDFKLSLA